MKPDLTPKTGGVASIGLELGAHGNQDGIKTGTKGDHVVSALRSYIAGGEFGPGEKISLRKLAAALDVSVMPVRNAVAKLQSDGVVDIEPGRAVRIKKMGVSEFRELTTIRLQIEGFAAGLAAQNRSDEDIQAMQTFCSDFARMAIDRDVPPSVASRVNMGFHFAVYRAAGMPMLSDIIERLWIKAGPSVSYFIKSERSPVPTNHGIDLHRRALRGIIARDSEEAKSAIMRDIELASERLISADIFDG